MQKRNSCEIKKFPCTIFYEADNSPTKLSIISELNCSMEDTKIISETKEDFIYILPNEKDELYKKISNLSQILDIHKIGILYLKELVFFTNFS